MHRVLLLLFIAANLATAAAQGGCPRNESPVRVQIQLTLERTAEATTDVGVADAANNAKNNAGSSSQQQGHQFNPQMNIRVELQDSFGTRVSEGSPNGEGRLSFNVCPRAEFRVHVTATDFEEVTAENLSPGRGDKMVNLVLHRKNTDAGKTSPGKAIAASRLKIPKKAQKALDRGNAALASGDLNKARSSFEAAIAIYPQFDQAYNNLGVVLMEEGDRHAGEAAFEKAVEINPHFARALSNLANISLENKQFDKGLALIRRSLATEPLNPSGLMHGIELAYFAGNYQEAISYTRTLHSLRHDGMGLAHFLCAKSLEKENQLDQALAEYQLFMQEAPRDPNVPRAQMAVASIRTASRP
jgi:Tfp pilus assembly protein PilF